MVGIISKSEILFVRHGWTAEFTFTGVSKKANKNKNDVMNDLEPYRAHEFVEHF